MYTEREKVFWFAIFSRIAILLLQFFFNILCPDHDADAFRSPVDETERYSSLDSIVTVFTRGLTRWDAQYFIHIAKYGYTYENTLVFFPLFPILSRYVTRFLEIIPPILNYSNTIVISGIVINFVCFVKAALILYDLSQLVFKDTRVAYRAAILFCINPASIFFTALYTESLFVYFTFSSMYESLNNSSCTFIPLSLSSLVRSNGLINIGFPVYIWFRNMIVTTIPNFISENRLYHSNGTSILFNFRHILISLSHIFATIILSLLPFCYLQKYNYELFCKLESNITTFPYHVQKYAQDNNLLLAGKSDSPWCNSTIPFSYSYIQDKYWNVGFLKYYQFKQIPNFILAFPILYIMVKCIFEYFIEHISQFKTLEFFTGIAKTSNSNNQKYPLEMFVFLVHSFALTTLCIFCIHIQVSTRFLCSASPVLYWYCALATISEIDTKKDDQKEFECLENRLSRWKVFFLSQPKYTRKEKLIYGYFLGYFVVGTFMFANFLPWT